MTIIFKDIPNALDKDKQIIIDGNVVGVVDKGWLRNGGNQWVATMNQKFLRASAFGGKTLDEVKQQIQHKLSQQQRDSTEWD